MSLINDALQRAKEAPPPKTHTLSSCQITPPPEGTARKQSVLLLLGIVVLAFVIGIVTVLLVQGLGKPVGNHELSEALPVTARTVDVKPAPSPDEPTTTQSALIPSAATTQASAALPAQNPSSESISSPSVAPSVAASASTAMAAPATKAAAAPESAATFPVVRLQGIIFRRINPSVMINSKSLFVGETVDEVTVKNIQRESVTLEWRGETKILTLR